MRHAIVMFVMICLLPLPVPTTTAQTDPPNKAGLHLLLDDGRGTWPTTAWASHIATAAAIAGQHAFVTQLVRADDLDLDRWQYFLDLCALFDLQPIIRLATTFDHDNGFWRAPQADTDGNYTRAANEYAGFIAALNWHTVPRIVVHNEPNHGTEWGGRPDPAAYARFLRDVANAIHSAQPDAIVMNAGFDHYAPHTGSQPLANGIYYMDAESFMDGMIAAVPNVFTLIDAWASHPYPVGAFVQPPWVQEFGVNYINDAANPNAITPPPGLYFNRGINAYAWELYKLGSYGVGALPVYITETGWRHSDGVTDSPYPSPQTVATYIDLAMYGNNGRYRDLPENGWTPWQTDPHVVAVTFFALGGNPAEWGHTNWVQLNDEGFITGFLPQAGVLP